ncbi:MAG: signal recognition particle protein Srp54, partial [Acidobacteria bacterium]|nr:signal recognition particle protein Srp54 [Acidobacteriota bacterium]
VPNVVMIVGLQGSGKTTSTGKIALWLSKNQERKPLLVSTDVNRPAAREQLKIIAKATGQQIFEKPESNDAVELAREAFKHAQQTGFDTLLIDTAGRLHIDEELMDELVKIKAETRPVEILFVADAMTGQDAVRSAEQFHAQVGITGVVLTKMDGDARGGAALSIKQVTGQPVKFVGVGEKYDALEPFYPDRIAQRILGMGDVLSLIEEVQSKIDQTEAETQLKKLQKNEFTLDDFRNQLRQVKRLGSFSKIMKLLPDQLLGGIGMPELNEEQTAQMEKELKRTEAIIDSMTNEERNDHRILNANRRRRIARGSGTNVSEVNQLLKQYVDQRPHDAPHGRRDGNARHVRHDGRRGRQRPKRPPATSARHGRRRRRGPQKVSQETETQKETMNDECGMMNEMRLRRDLHHLSLCIHYSIWRIENC